MYSCNKKRLNVFQNDCKDYAQHNENKNKKEIRRQINANVILIANIIVAGDQ